MNGEQIIEMIRNNQIDPSWQIFRYNKTRSFLMLLYKIFFSGLFLGISGILFFYSNSPLSSDLKLTIYGLGGLGLIGLLILLHHIYTLFFLRSTMIVCTPTEVIKSIRGTVKSWPYTAIQNLHIRVSQANKNTMPTYSIEFNDNKNKGQIIEFVRGHEFASPQEIFDVLKTKVS